MNTLAPHDDPTAPALRLLTTGRAHIFLTGRAGTGKTTLLRKFLKQMEGRAAVVAPTGVAAMNAGGQTIHSFFRFPPRLIEPQDIRRLRHARLLKELDTLVIDEISMVRADMMAAIDHSLRLHRDSSEPFGGVRMIVVGDLAQLPPVVDRQVGQYLDDWFGITLPFTTAGVVVAQTFVSMPFLVITVEAALRQLDPRLEEASRTLGASRWYTFRRVTMPAIRPALVAGAVLAWARALGEFGATITFAGNFPGTTQTMPLAVYLSLETNPEEAIVLALVMIAISFGVLLSLRDRWFGAVNRPVQVAA